jgi:hypothetical protein
LGIHLSLCIIAFALPACIQGSPGAGSRSYQRHVSTKAPSPGHRIDAQLGDGLELIGYDLEPDEPGPGNDLRLTWYWHCKQPLGGNWQIFTHLVDRRSGDIVEGGNLDGATVDNLRAAYPPSRWKAGEFISDVQRITLPDKILVEQAEFRIGIYQDRDRLPITKGPDDGTRRVRGPSFDTGWVPPPIPEVVVPRATSELAIDGLLDEADWGRALRTDAFVNATDGSQGAPSTKARLLYDEATLYVAFECDDDHLHSTFTKRDEPLWTQDAVEVFIDPRGRGRDYYEIQVSPAGTIFDTLVHSHPRRDDSYDAGAKAAVQIRGSLNDESDVDQGWTVELAVPLTGLGGAKVDLGVSWRLNMFRLDDRRRGRAFLGWSPPLANTTHIPARFAKLSFAPLSFAPLAEAAPRLEPDAGNPDASQVSP